VALKATHGRIPMTGLWPRVPRRFWHVGPMARTVRDISLAYSLLAGPDGADGYAMSPLMIDAGVGATLNSPLRVDTPECWLRQFTTLNPKRTVTMERRDEQRRVRAIERARRFDQWSYHV